MHIYLGNARLWACLFLLKLHLILGLVSYFSTLDLNYCLSLIENIMIFHDFPWTPSKFHEFPGLESEIIKFHDFPSPAVDLIFLGAKANFTWKHNIMNIMIRADKTNVALHSKNLHVNILVV